MKIKAVNGFARILKSEGTPWVSCYPTSPVNNALGEEGMPILMMGEERFAVAVADSFSRVTNGKQIGVCTVMAGLNAAGIQMAFGAIAQAWEDSSPLLVIAEGLGVGASRHTHFDMAEAFRPVTKWVGKVDRADLIPEYTRRAYTHLRSGRPGPVLLLIPRDLGEYDADEHPYSPVKGWRTGPDPDDVKAAIRALLSAKDPLLHIGEGVCYADAAAELLQFAEAAQIPVMTTLKGKGVFPENHPLSIGVRGSMVDHFLRKCDLLFSVGSSLFPGRFSHTVPDAHKKTIVQCTVDTLDINRSYETRHAVIGDAKLTLQALHGRAAGQGRAQEAGGAGGDPRDSARSSRTSSARGSSPTRRRSIPIASSATWPRSSTPRTRSSPRTPATRAIRPARCTRPRSRAAISAGAMSPRSASAWPARWRPSSPTRSGSACS